MGWGWIRITILGTAFLIGWMMLGPSGTSAGVDETPRMTQHVGGALIVACDNGNVSVKHISGEPGAVQLECAAGKVVVVKNKQKTASSRYHLLGL